jgi:ribosomal protein S18 acetylase RimI-like enzyme
MEKVRISTLHPDEWQVYKKLRLEALQCEPQAFGTSYAEALQKPDAYWRERLEKIDPAHGSWMLFAVKAGTPIGMVAAYTSGPDRADIVSVYVTAAERGHGVGRMLLEAILCQIASCSSVKVAALSVNKGQCAAVALYSSLGFIVVGEVTATLGDGHTYEEYMMEKVLD